jgi:aryl carrier-like protein
VRVLLEENFEKIACIELRRQIPGHYSMKGVRRISLPTYPFAGERYWGSSQRGDQRSAAEKNPGAQTRSSQKATPRQNSIEYSVTRVLKEILGLSSELMINPRKQLTDYGMDSVSAMKFLEELRRELGIEFDFRRFMSEFTLQEIIRQIDLSKPSQDSAGVEETTQPLSWEMDKALPDRLIFDKHVTPFKHNAPPNKVFLTGITGLVGAFLCDEILQKTSATVYCLVRAESKGSAMICIQDNLKSTAYGKQSTSRVLYRLGRFNKASVGN